MQSIAQTLFNFALIFCGLHVDEIDHDQSAQVSQSELSANFFSGLKVRSEGSLFDIGSTRRAGRVYVDCDECLGVVDHDGTT